MITHRTLADEHPHLVDEWHPTKNRDLTPAKLTVGSKRKVWWKCPKGPDHEWQATPNNRTSSGSGCPYCAGKRPSATTSLLALRPDLSKQWHRTKNGDLTPEKVTFGSRKKVWWKCPKGPDHEWSASVAHRAVSGQGCPCCSGHKVSVTNSLATHRPDLVKQWHPQKNGDLTPEKVVHPVNGEVPPVKGRPWKLPHYANRGKTTSSGGELASARSCFSTVRTALGKLRITGLLAQFDVARSFPQFPRPLLLQPTILTSERGTRFGIRKAPNHVPTSPFTG